jgi:aquaporin Z
MKNKLLAEFFGTFWLTFGGCGSAVLAGKFFATEGATPINLGIGLGLTLIHLIGIPVTGVSVNPARSTGPAVFVGGWALQQLWLFWIAPLLGAALAGIVYPLMAGDSKQSG